MSPAPPPEHELVATETTVVYSNRWMTVREDKTRRYDGREGIYGVVEKPDFALVVPYADGGFHLVPRRPGSAPGRWSRWVTCSRPTATATRGSTSCSRPT